MKKSNAANFVICICISFLTGCGALQDKRAGSYTQEYSDGNKIGQTDTRKIKNKLYIQFDKWRGVRYKLGGLSQHGIDCSGFVYVTFKAKLGLDLPRTTELQSRLGKEILKPDLRAGDLVFFKTGFNSKHVGIYLEKNKFLHASRSKGVTISNLDNQYWRSNYWKSVRI